MQISRRSFIGVTSGALAWLSLSPVHAALTKGRRTRFVFLTDCHTRTEWQTPDALMLAAERINALKPDFIIAGGDLITDGFQSSADIVAPRWDAYMRFHAALKAPVHTVLGNHDLVAALPEDGTAPAEDPRAVFRKRIGVDRTYGSFDFGGYHFVMLDSIHVTGGRYKYEGRVSAEQLSWLEKDLENSDPAVPIILCTHIPLMTAFYQYRLGAGEAAPPNRVVLNNREVLEAFADRNLLLVLQGHLHVQEQIRWQGTTFLTGGAVCAKWWRGPYHGTEEGFYVITLDDQTVNTDYIDYGWEARRPPNQ
jgi:3',5'-cyclic AMP phosphodiesterase CpdA